MKKWLLCGRILIHQHLSTAYETLVRLILSEGLLECFELTDVRSTENGQMNIYREEKNFPLRDMKNSSLNQVFIGDSYSGFSDSRP